MPSLPDQIQQRPGHPRVTRRPPTLGWRKHLTRRLPDLVPWIFDYYTKLGFSPAHKIHALRRVSASSALSSFFGYRGLGLVGQWKLKSSVMRMPIQPLTWLVAVIAGWVQRDKQAAIVYLLEKNRSPQSSASREEALLKPWRTLVEAQFETR